jgi:uncharacterized protein (TIGR03083 family)
MLDLVAAYAADAAAADDVAVVEAHLAASPAAAGYERTLRASAGSYATAVLPDAESPAPAELRSQILDAALRRRPGRPPAPASAVGTHRLATERAVALLRRLASHQWSTVVDPPELQGWTVHQLVAHLASNEALLAQLLGVTDPDAHVPELDNSNEVRTAAVQARLLPVEPAVALAEYVALVEAVDRHLAGLSPTELEAEIRWWGIDMRISSALIVRSLETWTHADDIRRAVGLAHERPAAPDLLTMSARSLEWAPIMMASTGATIPAATALLRLTGPGGGDHVVQLGAEPAPIGAEPRFELALDVVDYCRAVSNRIAPDDLRHESRGDTELAARFVGALPSLAAV